MCVSVPQIPTAATRTNTSRDETCGRGTSRTSSRATSISTHAFIVAASGDGIVLSCVVVDALTYLPRNGRLPSEFRFNIARVQTPGIAQNREPPHGFTHTGFERSRRQIADRLSDRC